MKLKERPKFTGTTSTEVQPYETAHRAVSRKAAANSITLLKNEDHLLPIFTDTPIALYGAGAGRTIKGGTGSADMNERYSVSVYDGLKEAGYTITTEDWIEDYDKRFMDARYAWKDAIWEEADRQNVGSIQLFQIYSSMAFSYPAGDLDIQKTDADTALYVLSRVAGEGSDRFDRKGDYYLSDEEAQLIDKICDLYPNVVLVLNSGGEVDLGFTDEHPNIKAIVQMCQLGCEGGNGFADVLSGKVNPAGKLASTWAYHYEDYPSSATFSHNNGNVDKEYYEEGIYVGYRYFDSFHVPVRYGFGYGLSYTDFEMEMTEITSSEQEPKMPQIQVQVTVTNTGTCAGREVVQIYASCSQEKLSKEYRRLVGFTKTKELNPGESEEVTINFTAYDLASYWESTPGWVLEAGTYGIFVGNSLESSVLSATIEVKNDQILTRTEPICPLEDPLTEMDGPVEQVKELRDAWLDKKKELPCIELADDAFETETIVYGTEWERIPQKVKDFVDTLSVDQLVSLCTGAIGLDLMTSTVGAAGSAVPGSAAQVSDCAKDQGLAEIVFADGPAGLRLNQTYYVKDGEIVPDPALKALESGFLMRDYEEPEGTKYYQYCTGFPCGTALAQSWDIELLQSVGKAVAEEMQMMLITSWLAPGMNIQRNPLCGRDFEYFSEDPLISGRMAAAITDGVQSEKGCGTTIKHFACNNQEDNRFHSCSIVSERTLREIYLKGFEIAIKESQPMMIMTSYNKLNEIHTANSYDLCTKAARDEWGFKGFIMTDWTTTQNGSTAPGCVQARNDMIMPGTPQDHEDICKALDDGTLTVHDLKVCVCHVVNIIWQSNLYE